MEIPSFLRIFYFYLTIYLKGKSVSIILLSFLSLDLSEIYSTLLSFYLIYVAGDKLSTRPTLSSLYKNFPSLKKVLELLL